ncbi:MAG TPA: electron transfer flavoprotein subunit alpha/FixB family protein [Euzebyales bacterium]
MSAAHVTGPALLAFVEHESGVVDETGLELVSAGRAIAEDLGAVLHAIVIGPGAETALERLGAYGAAHAHVVAHPDLAAYAPAAYAESIIQLMGTHEAVGVLASGTEKGNEVLAHVAARTDLPMAANCTEVAAADGAPWALTRLRWGGSLLEDAELDASTKLATLAPHAFQAAEVNGAGIGGVTSAASRGAGIGGVRASAASRGAGIETVAATEFQPELDGASTAVHVVDHEPSGGGVSLASAPVVISGGRGVGSAEGFAVLEELAGLLEGAVGCSRVATNNGWRSHSDQVGQTGTKIAPQLYVACGISGATQHWVGCKDSKNILAINTDQEAPLVTRGNYAVIGSLQEVLPAIVDEVRRRKGA